MSAGTVLLCLCGCPKDRHKQGKKACGQCGVCDAFELDGEVPAASQRGVAAGAPVIPLAGASFHGAARAVENPTVRAALGQELFGESTSAKLRRVEQERDEATATVDRLSTALTSALKDADLARAELADWMRKAELHRSELASARQELEQLRRASDAELQRLIPRAEQAEATLRRVDEAAGRDIADQFGDDLAARVADLRAGRDQATARALELADQVGQMWEANTRLIRERDITRRAAQTTAAIAAESGLLYGYAAWQCLTPGGCGSRYTRETAIRDHPCGPLTPVRVAITRRPA